MFLRKIILFVLIMVPTLSQAAENFCGEVQRLRTWATGSDTYGIWVEYKANPSQCPGGFYIPHEGTNKDYVFSIALAAKMAKESVCIQVYSYSTNIQNRCRINYIMNP
ncbi:hypothetical protein HWQ46_15110 [Shewanella sp. D64]|uniref:hypothetical protein n=1 Tax=unclassified Shewanella TaxID=196818 RepID=UPI0022BA328E|nr:MULTISPECIES: hypothetical protein [unclassified Shewanella]MEC4726880.1 hypothetical protein [Shewanella sp. D64]MEC4738623.1 hypothetical protein [Shewanella sp. E94]WBJ93838.1 hypothetical protein HWQ47_18155 [Shewanella sp. MTB7]